MQPQQSLPQMKQSPFATWAYSHPFYNEVFDWLIRRIFGLSEPALLLVLGPTGVGKSTMIRHLCSQLAERMVGAMHADPSRLHKVYAEAVYIPTLGFDWEGLFTALLEDAAEIMIDRKIEKTWPPKKPGLRGLVSATNSMLRFHAPAACIIDEGGSFVESDSPESLKRVLEFLKSIGNRSKAHIVIFGDYRLAKMVHFNGQLNRRCHVMHFPNYPAGYEETFARVVEAFDARFKSCDVPANVSEASSMLFDGTCGCVGLLKRWLEDAWLASIPERALIDKAVLEATIFPTGSINRWRAEIASGHEQVKLFFEGQKNRSI